MRLVEQHRMAYHVPHVGTIAAAAFARKNLSHAARCQIRQWDAQGLTVCVYDGRFAGLIPPRPAYPAAPAQAAHWGVKQVGRAWKRAFAALVGGQAPLRALWWRHHLLLAGRHRWRRTVTLLTTPERASRRLVLREGTLVCSRLPVRLAVSRLQASAGRRVRCIAPVPRGTEEATAPDEAVAGDEEKKPAFSTGECPRQTGGVLSPDRCPTRRAAPAALEGHAASYTAKRSPRVCGCRALGRAGRSGVRAATRRRDHNGVHHNHHCAALRRLERLGGKVHGRRTWDGECRYHPSQEQSGESGCVARSVRFVLTTGTTWLDRPSYQIL
jgi:hypothetical protein